MELAMLASAAARFGPVLQLVKSKPQVGMWDDSELSSIAQALGGEGVQNGFLPFLKRIRDLSPESGIFEMLGSPEANALFRRVQEKAAEINNTHMVCCKLCGGRYEDSLSA